MSWAWLVRKMHSGVMVWGHGLFIVLEERKGSHT